METPEDNDAHSYGPLEGLIGTWSGASGMDLAPEPDGPDYSPFYETISFEPIDDTENAEEQVLMALRYQQIVRRKSNDKIFHDQTGYWMWDAESQVVMQSLSIPRAVCLLAGSKYEAAAGEAIVLSVSASADSQDWGIVQSPFMREKARTIAFEQRLTLQGDTLSYFETTHLEIYGRSFAHTDENELTRQPKA
jgi:hypothetical protein